MRLPSEVSGFRLATEACMSFFEAVASAMTSVPFRIRGVLTGFVDLEGVARVEGQDLCLEFTMNTVFSRYVKSKPKVVRVPLTELEDAVFKHVLCVGLLKVRARSLNAFSEVPGNEGCELRLRIRREHWPAAQELASRLNMKTVEHQLRTLVAETEHAIQVLPRSSGATGSTEPPKRQATPGRQAE
jgi:hypothetical protein